MWCHLTMGNTEGIYILSVRFTSLPPCFQQTNIDVRTFEVTPGYYDYNSNSCLLFNHIYLYILLIPALNAISPPFLLP